MLKQFITVAIFAPCVLCFVPAHKVPPKPSVPAISVPKFQAAPTLQGASCGTIGPMGADAAIVTGANAATVDTAVDEKPFGVADILSAKLKMLFEELTKRLN